MSVTLSESEVVGGYKLADLRGTTVAGQSSMRKAITVSLALVLAASTACEKRTETQTVTDSSGTVQQKTTTVTATLPAVDTTATAEAKQDVKDAAHDAAAAARDAAHATGTALETAGKEIQKKTSRKH